MRPLTLPSPCEVHVFHPHRHVRLVADGPRRECSARFWCTACQRWFPGDPCHRDRPPGRKAAA